MPHNSHQDCYRLQLASSRPKVREPPLFKPKRDKSTGLQLDGVDFRGCDLSTLDVRRTSLDGALTGPSIR